jgi:Rap1a immunity proteins
MRRLAMIALVLTTLTPAASLGQTEENRGSAGYLLQLCKTWLDSAEKEGDTVRNMGRTEPVRLAAAGVCVGFVVGVLETLRSIKLSCPPKDVRNPQIVQTVLSEIEKHPERMQEDFVVPVRVAMMKSWPCPKKRGPHRSGSGKR